MTLAFLLACAEPRWTPEGALAPHRAAFDDDGDGRVEEPEYTRRLWKGPEFSAVDADGDGDLSAEEFVVLHASQSATRFDGTAPETVVPGGKSWTMPRREQQVWEVLVWMGDALRASGGGGPDPALVDAAVRSRDMESAESRAVLGTMRPAWEARGWAWPEGLPSGPVEGAGRPNEQGSLVDADPSSVVTERIRAKLVQRRSAQPGVGSGKPPAHSSTGAPGVQ